MTTDLPLARAQTMVLGVAIQTGGNHLEIALPHQPLQAVNWQPRFQFDETALPFLAFFSFST